ncbi:MAG TPA: type II toxin-antitoxin system VapC family toxin [Caulobacteraceae bacterium]|nr:type II toxin-antitoxin system VapC family toxin [Caulobacteraceae bacterium]
MKFWDSSAIIPLLIDEPTTSRMRRLAIADPDMIVWWVTPLECSSAVFRRERAGSLTREAVDEATTRLAELAQAWDEVAPSGSVRETAARFLRVHDLRAGDSLRLAAAFEASHHRPAGLPFVTLDERLASAARREGFPLPEGAEFQNQ